MRCSKVVLIAVLATPLGCGGRASQSDEPSHAPVVESGGSFGVMISDGAAGLGSASGSAGASNASLHVDPTDMTSSGQAGGATLDAGSLGVGPGPTDAGPVDAGFGDAGCVLSRDISCIELPESTCGFMSEGRACNVDTDCAWLLVSDCCCSAPRYVLDASVVDGSTCVSHVCTRGFVLPG